MLCHRLKKIFFLNHTHTHKKRKISGGKGVSVYFEGRRSRCEGGGKRKTERKTTADNLDSVFHNGSCAASGQTTFPQLQER